MPGSYSVMDMGYVDAGGGPAHRRTATHGDHAGTISVADLVERPRPAGRRRGRADRRQGTVTPRVGPRGRRLHAQRHLARPADRARPRATWSRCTLRQRDRRRRHQLHWHGVDVPNAEDGVAGVTQDAIGVGRGLHLPLRRRPRRDATGTTRTRSRTSRCCAGSSAPLVVQPTRPRRPATSTSLAVAHTYAGTRTLNGERGRRAASTPPTARPPGCGSSTPTTAPCRLGTGAPYQVARRRRPRRQRADGGDGQAVSVPAGGRSTSRSTRPPAPRPDRRCDRASWSARTRAPAAAAAARRSTCCRYGAPAPLPFDPAHADRTFDYSHRPPARASSTASPGCGGPSTATCAPTCRCSSSTRATSWSSTIENHSGEVHPMHLHGHHAVVLVPRRRAGDRQPLVGRLARRRRRRDDDDRVRRRQPRHLDGPLPQPHARGAGARRPPDVRGRHRALPHRRRRRQLPE